MASIATSAVTARGRPCPRERSNETRRHGSRYPTARSTAFLLACRRSSAPSVLLSAPSRGPHLTVHSGARMLAGAVKTWRNLAGAAGAATSPGQGENGAKFPRTGEPAVACPAMALRAPLAAEIAARARRRRPLPAGRRRRRHDHARKAALEARSRRGRPPRGAPAARVGARLGDERQDDDLGDGGARSSRPSVRLAHNRSGANLVSGVASALLAARDAELGLFEVDEAALPEVARRLRPRAVWLGNLFRDQLDRYGELELVAGRWRETAARAAGLDATLVVNGDDPQVGDLARGARRHAIVFGLDDPRHASPELQHAADSKWCVRCGTPYVYAAAYIGHLGDYRCPRVRPRAAAAGRRRARDRAERPRERLVRARHARGRAARRAARAGPLQRLQRARRGVALARARSRARRDRGRFAGVFRRVRPLRADRDRRPLAARPADQEPGRSERGRPHARRRRRPARAADRAQRRDRRRARRLLDLGRRLRAAARPALERLSRPASARPSWRCASSTPGSTESRSTSCRRSRRRSTAGSS